MAYGYFRVTDRSQHGKEGYQRAAFQDFLATAIGRSQLRGPNPAKLSVFEYTLQDAVAHKHGPHSPVARAALHEVDRSIGRVLQRLRSEGLLASSM